MQHRSEMNAIIKDNFISYQSVACIDALEAHLDDGGV